MTKVKTRAGTLRGRIAPDGIRRFVGVPFAQPPVGPLRFRAPQPVVFWEGVREAAEFALPPIQPGRNASDSSEDCLYLNLWVPEGKGPHPVLVWVHGGGNNGGWSGDSGQNGTSFARAGVLCVTLSYRVGALGYLELGDLLGPEYRGSGSNGIRDLAAGLRWVHENIAAFGGDPARITLAGQSAGAKNVAALLALPDTGKQIKRAILESGTGQTIHSLEDAQDVARRMLDALHLTKAEAPRLLELSTQDILNAQNRMAGSYPHAFPFRPVIDGKFLAKRPVDAVAAGASRNVSLLIGTNRDESLGFFAADAVTHPVGSREVANLPSTEDLTALEARYRQRFPEIPDLERRVHFVTAEEYWVPSIRLAEAHAAAGGETRMYRFDHAPRTGSHAGFAVHAAELAFVWDHLPSTATEEERALGRAIREAWVSFIATGTPRAAGLPDWPKYEKDKRSTLIFRDVASGIIEDPDAAGRTFWDGIL